ncbi:MAG: HEAT repeat domain-containing protein [Methanosarcina sp.]|jgi:HEAT repeat protein
MCMIKLHELFSCRHAKFLILLIFLLSGICAGCLDQDPLEARVKKLTHSLGDKDQNVSYASVYALVDIGEPAVDSLIKALKDDNPQVRSLAALALGRIGDQKAVDSLIEVLDDPSPEVRMSAAFSLGSLGAAEAVEPLIELLKDENENVVLSAVSSLGELRDPRAVEPICEVLNGILNGNNYDARWKIASALRGIGDPRAIDTLLNLLGDKELGPSVASMLGNFESEQVFGKVIKLLDSRDPTTRANAVAVFEYLQDPDAVPYLVEMLDDGASEVRKEAAFALGFYNKPEEAVRIEQPLINALADSEPEVKEAAVRSLGRIKSKESIPYLEELLQDNNQNLQIAAIEALGKIGEPEAVDALTPLLENKKWKVRTEVVVALVEIGGPEAVNSLISLLGDENYRVRQGAAEGLGKFGDQRAVEPLLKALETERERDVRAAEVRALGELGGPEAIEGLRRINTDMEEYWNVRTAAGDILKTLEGVEEANVSSTS